MRRALPIAIAFVLLLAPSAAAAHELTVLAPGSGELDLGTVSTPRLVHATLASRQDVLDHAIRNHRGNQIEVGGVGADISDHLAILEAQLAHADAIIAECPQDCVDLISLYNAEREKIRIIPCGFDAREFWPVTRGFARRLLGFGKDERIVLHVGRIVPRKGVDNVIRALGRLARATGIRARLVVVGGNSDTPDFAATPEIGRLHDIAREEGVLEQILFTGRRSREVLKLYYSAADVFVTTPWYEPFGITPLEAMACGTPVVGSAVGGIKHSVVDGMTGYLVPANDPDALAGRLAHLYRNPALLGKFAHNSVQRVNAHFTWERVARSVAKVYDEFAPQRPAAPARGEAVARARAYRQPSGIPAR